MGATVRKSDFIDAMEENQKDVRKMVMDSYHDIEKGKGRENRAETGFQRSADPRDIGRVFGLIKAL